MIEVIGLDEKDIDKAMLDGNGMPVRAPRDLKDGEIFWFYMGPGTVKPCKPFATIGRRYTINGDPRLEAGYVDAEEYYANLLKGKGLLREMAE